MFSEVRRKIEKIDNQLNDLRISILADIAMSGENPLLFKILDFCEEIQPKITSVKNSIMDSETEDEEICRELWEEEQTKLEEEYYKEENINEE